MDRKQADVDATILAHPPERRRRSTTLAAAACSCCCCCCVHSMGGIVGAILGGRRRSLPFPDPLPIEAAVREEAEKKAASRYAVKIYWLAFAITTLIALFVGVFTNLEHVEIVAVVVAVFLPLGQLAGSLLTLIYIQIFPPVRKADCLKRLGWITLFGVIGAVVGCVGTILTLTVIR